MTLRKTRPLKSAWPMKNMKNRVVTAKNLNPPEILAMQTDKDGEAINEEFSTRKGAAEAWAGYRY